MEDESLVVYSFEKNEQEAVCIGFNTYHDKQYVFIRTYVATINGAGDLIPTPKGINLPIESFPQLLKGIKDVGNVIGRDKVVCRIPKARNEQIQISFCHFKGIPLIDIRTFFYSESQKEHVPSKKGVSINVDLYPYLLEGMEKLQKQIEPELKKRSDEIQKKKFIDSERETPDNFEIEGLYPADNYIMLNEVRVTKEDYPDCIDSEEFQCENCSFAKPDNCPVLKNDLNLESFRLMHKNIR